MRQITLTEKPGLIGLDGAEVVVSVRGEDGGCNGRFKGVWGAGIFVLCASAVICLLDEDAGFDVAVGSLSSCRVACPSEPVSDAEMTPIGAGISNDF
jgi:hypothetical protein